MNLQFTDNAFDLLIVEEKLIPLKKVISRLYENN